MFAASLATLLFAISAVSAHRSSKILGGIEANFWRITIASILLGLWAHVYGKGITGEGFPIFLLSGLVGFGIGDVALYQAYPRLGSRLSIMLVHCLAAPLAALTEWLWMGTTLTPIQILCSATILAGVCLALIPGEHLNVPRSTMLVGTVFGVIAATGQGLGAVLSRKANHVGRLAGEPIDGISAAYQRILAGWLVAIVMLLVAQAIRSHKSGADSSGVTLPEGGKRDSVWYWVLINALAGPALGVSCYQWALASAPTGIVLPIIGITPLVVIPFARVMEGERPGFLSMLGGVVAVIGAVLLALNRH